VILLAFYWTLEGQRAVRYLVLLVPQNQREDIRIIYEEIELKVGNYIRGLFLVSLIVGGMALASYWIIGLPYALSLALIAGVFEAIPIIGPALGAIPAIAIALSTGDNSIVLGVIIAVLIIQAVENYILGPRILGHSVGVNPIVTLLALVTFTSLLGFAGALLAIPLAAVFQIVIDRFLLKSDVLEEDIPQGRDQISALRVELKELSTDVRKKIREKDDEMGEDEDKVEDFLERIASDLDQVLVQASERGILLEEMGYEAVSMVYGGGPGHAGGRTAAVGIPRSGRAFLPVAGPGCDFSPFDPASEEPGISPNSGSFAPVPARNRVTGKSYLSGMGVSYPGDVTGCRQPGRILCPSPEPVVAREYRPASYRGAAPAAR
jgi:hypothetical protein